MSRICCWRAPPRAPRSSASGWPWEPSAAASPQLLVETLLLALAGSVLGLALADQMRASLVRLLPATSVPTIRLDAGLDWRVLLVTVVLARAGTLVAGLVPVLEAAGRNVGGAQKGGAGGGPGGPRSHRLRGALAV